MLQHRLPSSLLPIDRFRLQGRNEHEKCRAVQFVPHRLENGDVGWSAHTDPITELNKRAATLPERPHGWMVRCLHSLSLPRCPELVFRCSHRLHTAVASSRCAAAGGSCPRQRRRSRGRAVAAAGQGPGDWVPQPAEQLGWEGAGTDSDYDTDAELDLFPEEVSCWAGPVDRVEPVAVPPLGPAAPCAVQRGWRCRQVARRSSPLPILPLRPFPTPHPTPASKPAHQDARQPPPIYRPAWPRRRWAATPSLWWRTSWR